MTIGRFGLRIRNYDFPPFRPPSEANSLLLRVTRGCPWNRCTFCSMYKGMKFEIRDTEEILGDIELARDIYGDRARTPHMIKNGGGSIINIGSLGGLRCLGNMPAYC